MLYNINYMDSDLHSNRRQSQIKLSRHYSPIVPESKKSVQRSTNYLKQSEQIKSPYVAENSSKPLTNSLSTKSLNCLMITRMFAQETTIHGIWNFIRQDRHWFNRLTWFIAFGICFGACLYFITASVIRYLSFEVKTTTSIETVDEIDCPAITFCNENVGKKSFIGSNDVMLKMLTAMVVRRRDEFENKLKEVIQTCKHDVRNGSKVEEDMKLGYDFWRTYGITKAMSLLAPDSYYSVVKCWFKNQEVNCSTIFLNHMTDHGWCFTANPHPDIVRPLSLGLNRNDSAYGLTSNFTFLKFISTGPHNNLRLVLNVHQEEYCVSQHDTAGFKVLIHSPRIQPLFLLDRPIYLSPGYETHIGIRLRRDVKLTEFLGRCTEHQHLKLSPNATVYFKEACYLECISRNVYKRCNCVPAYGPARANFIMADELGVDYVKVCFTEMLCVKEYEQIIIENGFNSVCNFCKDPCTSSQYDYLISYSYFPSKVSFGYYSNLTETDKIETMRDNYLMVDIYIESMMVNVVTETQDFNVGSLIADMGGQLGFLLGMSVLSLFELIQFVMPIKRGKKLKKVEPNTQKFSNPNKF